MKRMVFITIHPNAPPNFARLHLKRGEKTEMTMAIPIKRFRYWDEKNKQYTVEAGHYELLIDSASNDIRCRVPFKIVTDF